MSALNLLQHQVNKFGMVTVMDALILDPQDNKPLLLLDTLKVTSITQEGETKDIRGGIGAPELLSFDYGRTVSLEIQDALASMSSLKLLWGAREVEDNMDYTAIFEAKATAGVIAIPDGIVLQDDSTSKMETVLVLDVDGNAPLTVAAVDADEKAITLGETDHNGTVKVFLPSTMAIAPTEGAIALAINSLDLPPTVRLIGDTFFIDQSTGKKIPVQIEIPRLKINMGASMTLEAEGDASVFDFNGKALVDSNKNFFIIKQLGLPGTEIGAKKD